MGPRRIGKTSLLLHVGSVSSSWNSHYRVAYVNLQDARCATLSGFFAVVSRKFGWANPVTTTSEFTDKIETIVQSEHLRPILCLDEFEQFLERKEEFPATFFVNLRACTGSGLSILISSRRPLSELEEEGLPSPFSNIFFTLSLDNFTEEDAQDFVNLSRPNVALFSAPEKEAILAFAKAHPLALMVACYFVVEARKSGDALETALRDAQKEMQRMTHQDWPLP